MNTLRSASRSGATALAMNTAQQHKAPSGEYTGRLTCPKCGSGVRFTIQSNGISRGQCSSGCGVHWCQ